VDKSVGRPITLPGRRAHVDAGRVGTKEKSR